jgi:GH15 family glucan-1,4-alpha-glucosidase
VQEDGAGWVLWATGQVLATLPPAERARPPLTVLQLADRASTRVLTLTQDGTRLPPASADYWEVPETSLTLGTVAPLLAGLEAAAAVYSDVGRSAFAGRLTVASIRLRAAVEASFGTRGYPRHVDGDAVDAAVTFVLPPFQQLPLAGAETAWSRATRVMRRPGGGLAPGEGWKQDGISWTPETALFALSAASTGRPAQARAWLWWLAEHRTASGSLPEKVLSNGEPAAVAPLAWTAALVVLTADALDRSAGS